MWIAINGRKGVCRYLSRDASHNATSRSCGCTSTGRAFPYQVSAVAQSKATSRLVGTEPDRVRGVGLRPHLARLRTPRLQHDKEPSCGSAKDA